MPLVGHRMNVCAVVSRRERSPVAVIPSAIAAVILTGAMNGTDYYPLPSEQVSGICKRKKTPVSFHKANPGDATPTPSTPHNLAGLHLRFRARGSTPFFSNPRTMNLQNTPWLTKTCQATCPENTQPQKPKHAYQLNLDLPYCGSRMTRACWVTHRVTLSLTHHPA